MSLFSHIVSRRLSAEYENVATEGLLYIVRSVPKAKRALVDLFRSAEPGISNEIVFVSQDGEGSTRPDLAGKGPDGRCEVFVENKFWAGFTAQQPVDYVRRLAKIQGATLLVVVVPEARAATVWSELERRLADAGIAASTMPVPAGFTALASTALGPRLALTTWANVLNCLSYAVADDAQGTADLEQLRSLCDAADREAFVPFTPAQLSDQDLANQIVQLSDLVMRVVAEARSQDVINLEGLRATHSWRRAGSYVRLGGPRAIGAWFGLDFGAWRRFGRTPIWLRFKNDPFSRAHLIRPVLHHWGAGTKRLVVDHNEQLLVGVDVPPGEERAVVLDRMVGQLADLHVALSGLGATDGVAEPPAIDE